MPFGVRLLTLILHGLLNVIPLVVNESIVPQSKSVWRSMSVSGSTTDAVYVTSIFEGSSVMSRQSVARSQSTVGIVKPSV